VRDSAPAFRALGRDRRSTVLLTCEHASAALPRGLRAGGRDREILRTHRGYDIGAWEIAGTLARWLGATAIGGRYSRLVADLNRAPGDPSLVLEAVDGRPVGFNARLGRSDIGTRVRRFHAPYHAEIDRQVARRLWGGLSPLLLSVHSFTPVLHGRPRNFDLGVLYGDHRDLARGLAARLSRAGFAVALNRPYSGRRGLIYAAARHGANYFIPYLELEVNQRLLRTPATARRIASRIAPAIADLAGTLGQRRTRKPKAFRAWLLPKA